MDLAGLEAQYRIVRRPLSEKGVEKFAHVRAKCSVGLLHHRQMHQQNRIDFRIPRSQPARLPL